jgi:hypothetical protein
VEVARFGTHVGLEATVCSVGKFATRVSLDRGPTPTLCVYEESEASARKDETALLVIRSMDSVTSRN